MSSLTGCMAYKLGGADVEILIYSPHLFLHNFTMSDF